MANIFKHIILFLAIIFIFCIPTNLILFLGDNSNPNTCLKLEELYCIPCIIKYFLLITMLTVQKKTFLFLLLILLYIILFYSYKKINKTNIKKISSFIFLFIIFTISYYTTLKLNESDELFYTSYYLITLSFIIILYWFFFYYLLSIFLKNT